MKSLHHRCVTEITVALLVCLGLTGGLRSAAFAQASPEQGGPEYVERYEYRLNADGTFTLIETVEHTVMRDRDIDSAGRYGYTFDPDYQTFRVIDAWVEQPDGTRTGVAPDSVLVRPSPEARDAPGFMSTKTATLLFPQVQVGTKTHVKAEVVIVKPFPFGFNIVHGAGLFETADVDILIDAPKSLHLTVGQRDGFTISDRTEGGRRHIEAQAHVRDVSWDDREHHMPSYSDLSPFFVASTLSSYEELAGLYNKFAAGKDAVTPEIRALADKVAAGKTGRKAARALYDWVTHHIRYVFVSLNAESNWIPHDAATVLKNGFGDCKDHTVLLQALLSAEGIASEPVLVSWSKDRRDWPIASAQAFNHMIIYLPEYDLYANPTDEMAPFGVLDSDLRDKLVLHNGPNPRVSRTPDVTPDDARFTMRGAVTIAADGSIAGTAKADMSPMLERSLRYRLSDKEDRRNAMESRLSGMIPRGDWTGDLKTSDARDLDTPLTLTAEWSASRVLRFDQAGFILPGLPEFAPQASAQSYLGRGKPRLYPYHLEPKKFHWHFTVTPPPGQGFRALPPRVHVEKDVGLYTATYKLEKNVLVVDRQLVIKEREAKAAESDEVEDLARAVLNDVGSIVGLKEAAKAISGEG